MAAVSYLVNTKLLIRTCVIPALWCEDFAPCTSEISAVPTATERTADQKSVEKCELWRIKYYRVGTQHTPKGKPWGARLAAIASTSEGPRVILLKIRPPNNDVLKNIRHLTQTELQGKPPFFKNLMRGGLLWVHRPLKAFCCKICVFCCDIAISSSSSQSSYAATLCISCFLLKNRCIALSP